MGVTEMSFSSSDLLSTLQYRATMQCDWIPAMARRLTPSFPGVTSQSHLGCVTDMNDYGYVGLQ